MKKKENIKFTDLIADLSEYDKLRLYDFILRLRAPDEINQVYYTAKQNESQVANDKKSKICSKIDNQTNRNS